MSNIDKHTIEKRVNDWANLLIPRASPSTTLSLPSDLASISSLGELPEGTNSQQTPKQEEPLFMPPPKVLPTLHGNPTPREELAPLSPIEEEVSSKPKLTGVWDWDNVVRTGWTIEERILDDNLPNTREGQLALLLDQPPSPGLTPLITPSPPKNKGKQ
jgi:hypothetical protein